MEEPVSLEETEAWLSDVCAGLPETLEEVEDGLSVLDSVLEIKVEEEVGVSVTTFEELEDEVDTSVL